MFPTNSTLTPSCVVRFPSRTRTVTCVRPLSTVGTAGRERRRRKAAYLARDRLAVIVNGARNRTVLLCLGVYLLPEFLAFELDVNINRGREEERGHGAVSGNKSSEALSCCCFGVRTSLGGRLAGPSRYEEDGRGSLQYMTRDAAGLMTRDYLTAEQMRCSLLTRPRAVECRAYLST
jgi:hypothetical protein